MITSQNVPSEAQVKNFFVSYKSYLPFSRYSCLFFILYLQLTKLQLKTDIILYTNKNSYVLIIKKHANSRQLPNKNFLKL